MTPGGRQLLRRARDLTAPPLRHALSGVHQTLDLLAPERPTPAPIFIVGAPRSGSTILYQALTNALDLLYIDNVAARFYFDLTLGIAVSKLIYGDHPHENFRALHGDTSRFGGHAPSECGIFWYQWLPRDSHFVDHGSVSPRCLRQIKSAVERPSRRFGRPLIFKNLNAGQRLRLIYEVFPGARIIYITRDVEATVNSILRARHALGVPANDLWSVLPRQHEDLPLMPEEAMCREQVSRLEAQIEMDLPLFPSAQVYRVRCEELSERTINALQSWLGVGFREGFTMPEFKGAAAKDRGAA
jgi:hypothetical protein